MMKYIEVWEVSSEFIVYSHEMPSVSNHLRHVPQLGVPS